MKSTASNGSVVDSLVQSENPIITYRARRMLLRADPALPEMQTLRGRIGESEMARRLLAHRERDGTIATNPYKKWQGPHWTLYSLAQIDYPPGDSSLLPMRDQIYQWLLEPAHMQFPRSLCISGQEERFRRCGSQEGNTIWYSLVLGIADDRTQLFVNRLIEVQWPDGGWNCDKRPEARCSSIIETLIPIRALMLYGRLFDYRKAIDCARRAAGFLLDRRLLFRLHDGKIIRPTWGGAITEIHYPIQFYDVLFALSVMMEVGELDDPRCSEALGLLASKCLPDGGFPAEVGNCVTSETLVPRGSYAHWGPRGKRRSNPFVTIDALAVLRAAGSTSLA